METPIVSEISLVPIKPKYGHIAFASFVLFDALYISSVAVYTRPHGGIRLVYPRKKNLDVCHPIKHELGMMIEEAVMDEMQRYELI
jgi:hypothetical protein